MSDIKFELNTSAVQSEILKADWMLSCIESYAQGRCDSDSHIKSFKGFNRATAIIYPNTKENPG